MMGSIPSSVNVPLSNFEKALDLDSSDFMRAYGFRKPSKDQKIIFYCKSGKRSATATSLAKGKGFGNVRNYVGSWSDVRQSALIQFIVASPCACACLWFRLGSHTD